MKYTAEDGFEIESVKGETVEYQCASNYANGVYTSEEACGSTNKFGITQIKIRREIENGVCKCFITESNDVELQAYIDKIKQENENINQQI